MAFIPFAAPIPADREQDEPAALPAFVSPAWQSTLPDWYAANRLNRGLDLRGGSYLLLSLDTEQLLASKTAQSGGKGLSQLAVIVEPEGATA